MTESFPTGATPDSPQPEQGRTSFETGKDHALQAAQDLRAAAGEKAHQLKEAAEERAQRLAKATGEKAEQLKELAGQKASEFTDYASERTQQMREKLDTLKVEGEKYVKQNPARSVLTALGAGFVLGLLIRR